MTFNIIDEWLLILLIFGVWTCFVILIGYKMGCKLPKIRFVRGEPTPDAEDPVDQGSVIQDFEDPYEEALHGPPSKDNRIETL